MIKKTTKLFFIASIITNILFFSIIVKNILYIKIFKSIPESLTTIFSNDTFTLVVGDTQKPGCDFSILARTGEMKKNVFTVITSDEEIDFSCDQFYNDKNIDYFAFRKNHFISKTRAWHYILTVQNTKYYSYSKNLTWTYKEYIIGNKIKTSCFYKDKWEDADKHDIEKLIFHLNSGKTIKWNLREEHWIDMSGDRQ